MRVSALDTQDLMDRCRGDGLGWRVGPFVVRLRCGLADVARRIAFLYAGFPLVEGDDLVNADILVRPRWPRVADVFVNGRREYRRLSRDLVVPHIEWSLNLTVFEGLHRYFMIHSSVVARDDLAVVMPGDAGFGKSTLCAALVARGWRLFSDEVALVDPADRRLVPVPRPISLKGASIDVIRAFAPTLTLGPSWPGTMKGTVAHVLPPKQSVAAAERTGEPRWVVFPRFSRGVPTSLAPVSRAQALMRAASHAFNYERFGASGFEMLADMVGSSECFELTFGDLAAAVESFESLVPERAPRETATIDR